MNLPLGVGVGVGHARQRGVRLGVGQPRKQNADDWRATGDVPIGETAAKNESTNRKISSIRFMVPL